MTAASLPTPDVTDRSFWTSDQVTADCGPTLAAADAERGAPWPQPLASQYARFFRDGDRTVYEAHVAARHARLTRATLAALVDPSTERVDEVVDGVLLLCEQSTWCWAAHDDTFDRFGRVTPTVTEPYLDLGAGEVAAQLAWVDHLLGPALDERAPGVRWRVRQETQTRVLRPFTERRDWWWLGVDHPIMNWSPWIQGNVLAANLALEEDPDRRRAVSALVAEGIAAYWSSLPADGGVDEGYHYWWQGAARALEAQDLLGFAGIEPEPAALDRIRATVTFPHSMHLGGDWYVNVADGAARPLATWPWNIVHAWALRVGDDAAARHAASYRGLPGGLFDERASLPRAVRMLSDQAWAGAPAGAPAGTPPLVPSAVFPSTGVAVARSSAGTTRGLAVSVKGGHNGENHNHVDVGSVIVALDGVPVVVDAGKPTYRAGTFGPDRYASWVVRGDWHNVPRVRGVEQAPGEQFAARGFAVSDAAGAPDAGADVERRLGRTLSPQRATDPTFDDETRERAWRARVDLGGAYPVDGLESWWREVVLDRAASAVTVEDTWSFSAASTAVASPTTGDDLAGAPTSDCRTAWHWLLAGDVTLAPGSVLVRSTAVGGPTPADGPTSARALTISWDPEAADAELDVRELDDPELTAVWGEHLTRLRLTARTEAPSGTFRVTMRPTGSGSQEVV
ncbi:Heparinase II/III-like protein [Promicromonospora umidemergens]|uniref:Heparinase II/III family protein n=1 Tax=Promicromonospora umidemergens TaxID=629679 RepID=A0ABP8X118_9MICO|nr:heparinase II/III family protein [Promicromonospora umidemergens]MCP2285126.1 Heparinase II/III-like protein [Promicromonospora umidemergens]